MPEEGKGSQVTQPPRRGTQFELRQLASGAYLRSDRTD